MALFARGSALAAWLRTSNLASKKRRSFLAAPDLEPRSDSAGAEMPPSLSAAPAARSDGRWRPDPHTAHLGEAHFDSSHSSGDDLERTLEKFGAQQGIAVAGRPESGAVQA